MMTIEVNIVQIVLLCFVTQLVFILLVDPFTKRDCICVDRLIDMLKNRNTKR